MPTDLISADAATVAATVELVAQASSLTLPTPCAGWDLGALIAHMTEQHRIFASAALGVQIPSVRTYAAAAELVTSAFAAPGVLDRPFLLPEIHPSMTFPGRQAIGFHLVDYVVHGWDVAATLGVPYVVEPDVLALARPIARAVPDDASRQAPDAAFAPARPLPPGVSPLDEILLLLGRDPSWPKLSEGPVKNEA
ncbi:TIGR03086 family metal-binding protein [Paractinoplanes toevensis]|uniref:TIGR03086 family protein n=1 Tax=Paractinoplanes toevensis TaxID=571911 RepID=A0A919TAB6_9ACTN|nr:TIGR03086 family metal-binding protein [Actinoplanes toevensis]GIM91738.1 TIGR03086 family protein [Actinoplanes toevensis]